MKHDFEKEWIKEVKDCQISGKDLVTKYKNSCQDTYYIDVEMVIELLKEGAEIIKECKSKRS